MSEDQKLARYPSIRDSGLSITGASSRLLQRGLSALNEARSILLDVLDLIAFESSVFVLSDHWDRNAYPQEEWQDWLDREDYGQYYDGYYDHKIVPDGYYDSEINGTEPLRSDPDWLVREVTLYEFHRGGRYIRTIHLPLVRLSQKGYSLIRSRVPGKPIIRSEFIHFHERLHVLGYSRGVRIDYLFARNGERLAVWSNHSFFYAMRELNEPFVPSETTLKPEWATADTLLSMQPHDRAIIPEDRYSLKYPYGEILPDTEPYYEHIVSFRNYEDFATLASNPDLELWKKGQSSAEGVRRYLPEGAASMRRAELPFASHFVWGAGDKIFVSGWYASTSDPSGVWMMGHESGPIEQPLIRWEVVHGEPTISHYSLPHPYDLFRDHVLFAVGRDVNNRLLVWEPTQDDYRSAQTQYELEVSSVFSQMRYHLEFSWDKYVVMSLRARWHTEYRYNSEKTLVLFEHLNGRLLRRKRLDPSDMQANALEERSHAETNEQFDDEKDQLMNLPPYRHCAFSQGFLFSLCEFDDSTCSIIATNIDSEEVTSFLPEVPESELDKAWARLRS